MNEKELDKNIGQHLLADPQVTSKLIAEIPRGLNVMEIGAEPGLLTRHLAERSKRLVAVEIDKKFEDDLSLLARQHNNLKVFHGNVLDLLTPRRS